MFVIYKNSIPQFHSYNVNMYSIKLSLLTDVNYDYMFRLKLVMITSVPDMSTYHIMLSMF
jgi:hypothetical protein